MEWRELLDQCGMLHPGGEDLTKKMILASKVFSGKALDIACGVGIGCEQLIMNGFETVGVDADPLLTAEAEMRVKDAVIICSNANQLPFEEGSFDLVMCECSLSVFDEKECVLNEVIRVLRSGGKFIFSDLYSKECNDFFSLKGWVSLVESSGFFNTEIFSVDEVWRSFVARLIWEGINLKDLSSCVLPDVSPKDLSYFYAVTEKP